MPSSPSRILIAVTAALSLASATVAQTAAPHPVRTIDRDPYTDIFFKTPPLPPLALAAEDGPRSYGADLKATLDGRVTRYRAALEETLIRDETRKPVASLFTTSYVVTGTAAATRPVLFAFNGGPGSASVFVNYALGPQRLTWSDPRRADDPANVAVDNPLSILGDADLVVVDAPDTGYSKTLPGVEPGRLHSQDADSAAFAALIGHWLRSHGRTRSPVFIFGESYGSVRAIAVVRDLARSRPAVPVKGIVLAGPSMIISSWGRGPNPMLLANRLPMMASVAWRYGKIDNRGQTWAQAVQRAREFANREYLPALMEGYDLDQGAFDRIVTTLPTIVGIPEDYFRKAGKITVSHFNEELLRDQGLVLDSNNGLVTHRAGAPEAASYQAYRRAFETFSHDVLGTPAALGPYVTINMAVDQTWRHEAVSGAPTLNDTLAEVFRNDPEVRLLVLQGRYDTLTDLGMTEFMVAQADIPADRKHIAYYDGGHMLIPVSEAIAAIRNLVAH